MGLEYPVPYFYYKEEKDLGQLRLDTWHSKHAGQTVDDAVDAFRRIEERINEMYNNYAKIEADIASVVALIDKKYDKAGGPITAETETYKVIITGGAADPEKNSRLEVRHVDGLNKGVLCLNCLSPGDIKLGKGGARVDSTGRVYGAIWNDFAEYRISDENEPGRVICENGDGTLSRSHKRLQPGASIISDTFGFAIGETEYAKTPIAISGRVLAHTYEDWWTFEPGEPVCAGPNGTVSKMSRREVRKYPDRIIGTVSELPAYEYWGDNHIEVNNRIWIKLR